MMNYVDGSVSVVNSRFHKVNLVPGESVVAQVVGLNGSVVWQREVIPNTTSVFAGNSVSKFPHLKVPAYSLLAPLLRGSNTSVSTGAMSYFVRLSLPPTLPTGGEGAHKLVNWYWMSSKMDIVNWTDSNFYRTGVSQYADFTALKGLPPVALTINTTTSHMAGHCGLDVQITHPGSPAAVAFFVELQLMKGSTPVSAAGLQGVSFTDNYFSLMPGETVSIKVSASSVLPSPCGEYSVRAVTYNDVFQ